MTDPNLSGSIMPTGEEAPPGYELFNQKQAAPTDIIVNSVFVSQLAEIEVVELEQLRQLAMRGIVESIGTTHEDLSFEEELNILPGTDDSDRMLFRAYRDHRLVGYALLVIGWPKREDWVIQHMIINPENRLQGIGTAIVSTVESYARHSQSPDKVCLSAIPIDQSGRSFWALRGYTDEPATYQVPIAGEVKEILVVKKCL
ncbi:MAG: GNAT family N-acetyltransferase [Coriobacteriia bacterium]|nr:GNAT family N-acetyltransferase [Coriobacteriia bacterium]